MIEINLLEKKKKFRLPVVMGVDLNEVNWKPLVFAYILNILVSSFVLPLFDQDLPELQAQLTPLKKKLKKIEIENRKNKDLTQILEAFKAQIEVLKKREAEVEKVMALKTNPKNVLASISKIIPEDLWLDTLSIDNEKKILMEGEAVSYKSVGEFILKSNELEFFNGSITIKDSTTEEKTIKGKSYRLQRFKLEGKIVSFGVL